MSTETKTAESKPKIEVVIEDVLEMLAGDPKTQTKGMERAEIGAKFGLNKANTNRLFLNTPELKGKKTYRPGSRGGAGSRTLKELPFTVKRRDGSTVTPSTNGATSDGEATQIAGAALTQEKADAQKNAW